MYLDNKYPLFANFKIKILDVVTKEINKNTDIFIDYEVKKNGKKIVGLIFQVKENSE